MLRVDEDREINHHGKTIKPGDEESQEVGNFVE